MLWQILSREYERWPPDDPKNPSLVLDIPEPASRVGHAMATLPDGQMLLFGGWDGFNVTKNVYFYSPGTGKWSEILSGEDHPGYAGPITSGSAGPCPLAWHSASVFVRKETEAEAAQPTWHIIFYGGTSDMCDVQGVVYQLSIQMPVSSDSRPGTTSSSLSRTAPRLDDTTKSYKKTVSNLPSMHWTVIDFDDLQSDNYHHPAVRPPDRMQHTATPIDSARLLVLGGCGRAGRRLADLWELDTLAWAWRQIRIRGWGPASGHTAVPLRPGALLVFGGEAADGAPVPPTLWCIDYARAARVPILDVTQAPLHRPAAGPAGPAADSVVPPGRALHTLTEVRLLAIKDTHGDQACGLESAPPVQHPTLEPRYFFGAQRHLREEWSRDWSNKERLHHGQHYDRDRRFVLYGGFGEGGEGLSDVYELRVYTEGHRHVIVNQGEVLSLGAGSVGRVVQAAYGQRTSYMDVTDIVAELVRPDGSIAPIQVSNRLFGIIDRNEAKAEKRWRDKVDEWADAVGQADPAPALVKRLVVKYVLPADSEPALEWIKVPPHTPRHGHTIRGVGEAPLGDSLPQGQLALSTEQLSVHRDWPDAAEALCRAAADRTGRPGAGGGPAIGVPPGRGGHFCAHITSTIAGVGGLLVVGGASAPTANPSHLAAFQAQRGALGNVWGHVASSSVLLMVLCPDCALPLVSAPRRSCAHTKPSRARPPRPPAPGDAAAEPPGGELIPEDWDGDDGGGGGSIGNGGVAGHSRWQQSNECQLYCPLVDW